MIKHMEINKKYSIMDRLILENALKEMSKGNYESASIQQTIDCSGLNEQKVKSKYENDDHLRMQAMEYAAIMWIRHIEKDIDNEKDKQQRLKKLLRHFFAGTESHPASLSLYVDVWKCIRDSKSSNTEFIKEEINKLYELYVKVFEYFISKEFPEGAEPIAQIRQLAWILVVISDGLHIQSLIRSASLDYEGISELLNEMVKYMFYENKEVL